MFEHPGTTTLLQKLGFENIAQLYERLFTHKTNYNHVCFRRPDWSSDLAAEDWGTFYSVEQIHYLCYAYIVKRASVFPFFAAAEYRVRDSYSSKTDAAFIHFFEEVIKGRTTSYELAKPEEVRQSVASMPAKGDVVLMIKSKSSARAFKVFTEQPLLFAANTYIDHMNGPLEYMAVTFKDVEPKGNWETTWVRWLALACVMQDELTIFEIGAIAKVLEGHALSGQQVRIRGRAG